MRRYVASTLLKLVRASRQNLVQKQHLSDGVQLKLWKLRFDPLFIDLVPYSRKSRFSNATVRGRLEGAPPVETIQRVRSSEDLGVRCSKPLITSRIKLALA